MKTHLAIALFFTITLSLNACTTTNEIASNVKAKAASVVSTKTTPEATAAIAAAKSAQKKAASIGGEWRDTGKLIKKAEKAAKSGKSNEAITFAKKASQQGAWGYEQAMAQKNAGPRF